MALDCRYTYTPVNVLWNKQVSLLKWQGMPAVRTLKRVKQLLKALAVSLDKRLKLSRGTPKDRTEKHTLINKDENEHNRRTRLYTHHLTLKPDVHSVELNK